MVQKSVLYRLILGGASALALSIAVSACDNAGNQNNQTSQSERPASEQVQTESQRLYSFFEQAFEDDVARSPMRQAYLGRKTEDYGKWDDLSDQFADETLAIYQQRLETLKGFDADALDAQAKLSHRLFKILTQRDIDGEKWRHYSYPINQMFGWQQQIPSFLINIHRVTQPSDIEAYVSRLEGVSGLMDQILANVKKSEELGVVPPRFVYPLVLEASRNVITGAPFDESGDDSALWDDFNEKLAALDLSEDEATALREQGRDALLTSVQPAYERLIAELERQEQIATTDDGVWKLPNGEAYYNDRLQNYTTTDLSAAEIHQIGLDNVARIHEEMLGIMKQVEFVGNLQDFFEFIRTDEQFIYPNTDEGRAQYLNEAKALIDQMRDKLPDYFGILPKADMVVKRVEPFREKAAGKAFYQQPALDGSRPGTYYANLYDMTDMPIYQMEALAYHEGIPGHHMQIAISQELEGVPMFQRMARFTAYTEGWGLYSEYLPKEMGFYEDPYSDFGRLAMELWRAARLVVDTGLHDKKWTREEAIDYLRTNTPNPEGDLSKAIERYIVMPGQATAYMIGKEKILSLREEAREALGDAFDIRGYHDEVLKDGPLPLDILEEKINGWVEARKTAG
ncbi:MULTISPECIES: DUF885 domain-containing protein [unclassified Iodidimonas]|jgi:uncharacterized protein (DUF885 family)|uniref:DUF885 domain-containing protein n=1 Tax=unclassified Iodidimonas TaxID=2626145 RepID=UPI0024826841|nr:MULTISPECIES: DUF885 domain-containing protein [unclassified Iodidimonas]